MTDGVGSGGEADRLGLVDTDQLPAQLPPSDRPGVIELRNVCRLFTHSHYIHRAHEGVMACEGVDLEVGAGEFVTIVGPSGCGKTTLLNMIAGLLDPTDGQILINGVEDEDRTRHFSYMFQKDLLFPWRNIRDNVALGIEIQGTPRREAQRRAQAILDEFGLGAFADRHPVHLSGGMRQRAALMRTLLCDSDAILLDEPFGSLDALTRSKMQEWLLDIWERDGRTILFITHDVEEAVFLSDRVAVMSGRPGRIKRELVIDIPRPRDHTIVTTPRFVELKAIVLEEIYSEDGDNVGEMTR